MTLASNQFQTHNQALRHGMLTWVTRGVFLGYQRNYLGLDVDDVFLGDDRWDPVNNVTNYDFDQAIRMTAADVTNAVAWQNRTGLKLNMVYNMGGAQPELYGQDALFSALRASKNQFRWINHTFEHPNLDCTSEQYTRTQLTLNQGRFDQLLGGVSAGLNDPSEAVTGEHSGLANVRPGNPGTIDPPAFDDLVPTAGTLAGGNVRLRDHRHVADRRDRRLGRDDAGAPGQQRRDRNVQRGVPRNQLQAVPQRAGRECLVAGGHAAPPGPARHDRQRDRSDHPVDHGQRRRGTAAAPPAANGATLAPYTQNPAYVPALTTAGIRTVASDSSKPYPNPPNKGLPLSETDPTNFAKGATFPLSPTIQAVPRYPSNVYYNVANRADQLDEYNWIYTSPPTGGCVPITNVTTCNAAPVDWTYYLNSETRIMFGHLMGNDPRPHYFHQTNIAQSNPTATAAQTRRRRHALRGHRHAARALRPSLRPRLLPAAAALTAAGRRHAAPAGPLDGESRSRLRVAAGRRPPRGKRRSQCG